MLQAEGRPRQVTHHTSRATAHLFSGSLGATRPEYQVSVQGGIWNKVKQEPVWVSPHTILPQTPCGFSCGSPLKESQRGMEECKKTTLDLKVGFKEYIYIGFSGGTSGKEPTCQCRRCERCRFDPWVGMIPWRRAWQPIPVLLPGESHGLRSLVGYRPCGYKELDMT